MTLRPASIRVRLTLWYAVVLLSILVCLSAGVYVFVRASLERSLSANLDRDFGTVATVLAASPQGKGSGGHLPGDVLFMVMENRRVLYHSEGWCRAKFTPGVFAEPIGSTGVWRSIQGMPHRLKVRSMWLKGHELKVTVAEDTSIPDETLRNLLRLLLLSIPSAALLSIGSGYFLAGRALAPVSAMAAKSREITAESLSKRLPVSHPYDELGQMATVFNQTLERLEASFDRLRNFTANVSHELRTPLTAIRSVGEVALQHPRDADALRDVIGSMLEEVERLTRLVDCMLALARAESGHTPPAQIELDLAAEASATLELVRVLAEEKRQDVMVETSASATVRGDPAMMRQALLNLVDNAIRYTPEHGHVKLRVGRTREGDSVVEVEDDGPGIPVEERARIFDRFYRAAAGATVAAQGTGLGLTIARSAVEASGGRLEYETSDAGGSRFRMTFPCPRA
jgi:heavy metal sensor kinase